MGITLETTPGMGNNPRDNTRDDTTVNNTRDDTTVNNTRGCRKGELFTPGDAGRENSSHTG